MNKTTSQIAEHRSSDLKSRYKTPPGMRNIRVTVPEELFFKLHDMANASRMRFLPYMRRFLEEAFPMPSSSAPAPRE